jgi:hypothetical protein
MKARFASVPKPKFGFGRNQKQNPSTRGIGIMPSYREACLCLKASIIATVTSLG